MQYRLYTAQDKETFCDPENILLGVRDFFELSGEGEEKTFEKIKGLFPYTVSENSNTEFKNGKRATVFARNGRNDRMLSELYEVIALVKPKNEIKVRCGREFYFSSEAYGENVARFLKDNVNSYVFSDKYLPAPSEAYIDDENLYVDSFCSAQYDELIDIKNRLGITMEIDDLMCVQNYFISESREPSYTELKIIDSFFSENFRHTTFETILDKVETEDENVKRAWQHYRELHEKKTPSLSDITATPFEVIAPKDVVKATKKLNGIKIETRDENDELLLLVKNESHNRSVTSVPYDGASGAIGSALKDIYCALGYAYDSYRVIGRGKNEKTRKKAILSSAGYADAASQVGLPCEKCKETVSELYNEKQLEVCSVLAVADGKGTAKMLSKEPQPGDKIYLVGGKTGADGLNSAHRSLKQTESFGEYISVTDCGELSAMQRMFVRSDLADIAVAVNDVGSGGIVCALGEIVEDADINLNAIKLKYGGLSCADIALSESNERMIVCVRTENCARLESICKAEGVDYSCIASVSDEGRFTVYDAEGKKFVSLTREFLLSGGAEKHLTACVEKPGELPESEALAAVKAPLEAVSTLKKLFGSKPQYDFERAYLLSAGKLSSIKCELAHAFDIAADSAPPTHNGNAYKNDFSLRGLRYGGRAVIGKDGRQIYSALACATLPEISKLDPYKGAYLSVAESAVKLIAAGCVDDNIHLSLQEYFPEHKNSSVRLGVSVASMLGAFEAQMQLGIPSVGGRISIGSGVKEYEKASSVTAFAFCMCKREEVVGSSFKADGSKIFLISAELDKESGLPNGEAIKQLAESVRTLKYAGHLRSAKCVNAKNACTVLMEMCRAGRKGVKFEPDSSVDLIFGNSYCAILAEVSPDAVLPKGAELIGYVSEDFRFTRGDNVFELSGVIGIGKKTAGSSEYKEYLSINKPSELYGRVKPVFGEKVRVLIPDTGYTLAQNGIRAEFTRLGAEVRIQPVNADMISDLVRNLKKTDILWLPDSIGSSALMSAVLSDKRVRAEIDALRERKGLIYGFGSAFESLVVSGILEVDRTKLDFSGSNTAMLNEAVLIRASSMLSPFMRYAEPNKKYYGYVSGKRMRLLCVPEYADGLAKCGRIPTQYCLGHNAPESSVGIDSICSADGLVFGQSSRIVITESALPLIRSAIGYFSTYNNYDGVQPNV